MVPPLDILGRIPEPQPEPEPEMMTGDRQQQQQQSTTRMSPRQQKLAADAAQLRAEQAYELEMVRKTPLFAPFISKVHRFAQDRLGTNVGKTQKISGAFP
jgi:hypothetical protein